MENPVKENPIKKAWRFISTSSNSRTTGLLVILILVAAIPLTVIISQRQQHTRQQAQTTTAVPAGSTCPTGCTLPPGGFTVQWPIALFRSQVCLAGTSQCQPFAGPVTDTTYTWNLASLVYYDLHVDISWNGTDWFGWENQKNIGTNCYGPKTCNYTVTWARVDFQVNTTIDNITHTVTQPSVVTNQGVTYTYSSYTPGVSYTGTVSFKDFDNYGNTHSMPLSGTTTSCNCPSPTPTPPSSCTSPAILCGGSCQNPQCVNPSDIVKCRQDTGSAYCAGHNPPCNANEIFCPANPNAGCQPHQPCPSGQTLACAGGGWADCIQLTPSVSPSPTQAQGGTILSFTIGLADIGATGDNKSSDSSASNKNPKRAERQITATVLNGSNQPVSMQSGSVVFDSQSGKFKGTVSMGNLAAGNYIIKVSSPGYLRKQIPGVISITANQTNTVPPVDLVAGDINGDNRIDILDYQILISCAPSFTNTYNKAVCGNNTLNADLDDDGVVNEKDLSILQREFSVQNGD